MREYIYKEIIAKDKALIVLAFQRAGLVPFNPSIVLDKIEPCEKPSPHAMKLLKTWCSSTVTFAAQSPPVYGTMREVPQLALERGSKGPNIEVCFFSSLDEESTFEVQCVNLSNFF